MYAPHACVLDTVLVECSVLLRLYRGGPQAVPEDLRGDGGGKVS
jgi:hypothetical protein